MKRRPSFSEIVLIVLLILILVITLALLGIWTKYIERGENVKVLKEAMRDVVELNGEKALFELAGIDVDQIHYGSDGLDLFEGDTPSWDYTAEEARKIAIYDRVCDSVVQIQAASELSDSGQGSGVIMSSDGYIVTNKHVIGSGTSFNVNFSDGSAKKATLVGYDSLTDVALIKVDGNGLDAIETGSTSSLVVGQSVMAIGNPYGYTWSYTSGMVSGLDRMVFTNDGNVIPNMIQTDALINPGNSGGPLLNGKGEMVGLVSSIYSTSGSAQGISFALPVEVIEDVIKQIIATGSVHRGWLDILSVELNAQIVSYSSLPVSKGILISQVVPAGAADRSGLRGGTEKAQYGQSVIYLGGDIIVAINGKAVSSYVDYFAQLFSTKPGDKIDVTVNRKGQELMIKDVELVEQTEEMTKWILR